MKCIIQSIQFWIGSKEKNPPPLRIIWINNPFWDFTKQTKYRFGVKFRIWILVKKHIINVFCRSR